MNGERITKQVYQDWAQMPDGFREPQGWRFKDGNGAHDWVNDNWDIIENIDWDEHGNPTQAIARLRTHQIMPGEGMVSPLDATNSFPLDDATNRYPMTTGPLLFTPPSTTVPYEPKMWWEDDHGTNTPLDLTPEENIYYQKLTKFRKDVVDSLVKLGFKWKYNTTYGCAGWSDINVEKFNRWSDVLQYIHEDGKDQKRFEIQRILGI